MGRHKSKSDQRLKIRLELEVDNRDTLLPCPACNGSGHHYIEQYGRYRSLMCKWCNGTGTVEHQVIAMFRRWEKILAWNRARGMCPED